jgi:electron transfer flavoprotein alpha subunit
MLAVVFAREGVAPAGAAEVVAECAGRVLVCGTGTRQALEGLGARHGTVVETGNFAPGSLAGQLAPLIDDDIVVVPASPDGRDLAPRLARRLGRTLLAGAIEVRPDRVQLVRHGGRSLEIVHPVAPFVATLTVGVRTVPTEATARCEVTEAVADEGSATDVAVVEVLGAEASTVDLAEADRIVCGGAGLDHVERFDELGVVAQALGASVGGTRVITDRGWLSHSRQIGTTGAVVAPRLYLAFGISGAVQHTAGLGNPDHIVSVNTDPHCPMMQRADLAIVADANAVVAELAACLGDRHG